MEHIEIHIDVLFGGDLSGYQPDQAFWTKRSLWSRGDHLQQEDSLENVLKLVIVRVAFINTGNVEITIPFPLPSGRAELLNLRVSGSNGETVAPRHNIHIRPLKGSPNQTAILPRQVWSFDILGEFCEQGLIFPGAIFPVIQDEEYMIQFEFGGKCSNKVRIRTNEVFGIHTTKSSSIGSSGSE